MIDKTKAEWEVVDSGKLPAGGSRVDIEVYPRIAILQVLGPQACQLGFMSSDGSCLVRKEVISAPGGFFGARLGTEDVSFFVLPPYGGAPQPKLRLVEILDQEPDENDPPSASIPLY